MSSKERLPIVKAANIRSVASYANDSGANKTEKLKSSTENAKPKRKIERENQNYHDIEDSPTVTNDDDAPETIDPNKKINLYTAEMIALFAARACCGGLMTYGLTSGAIGQRYSNTLSVSTNNAIQILSNMPNMFVFFLALYMENKPLFGSFRKHYIIVSLCLAHGLVLLNGVLFPGVFAYRGVMCVNIFITVLYLIANNASSAMVVQRSNLEGIQYRGRVQVISSIYQTAGSFLASLLIGLALSGPSWTASSDYAFDFELSFFQFSLAYLAIQVPLLIVCCLFLKEPERPTVTCVHDCLDHNNSHSDMNKVPLSFTSALMKGLKSLQRPEIVLLIRFYLLSFIPLYVYNEFQMYFSMKFVGSTAFGRSMNGLLGTLLLILGLFMLKNKVLTLSWKVVYFWLVAIQLVYDCLQFIFFTGHLRNPYAYFLIGDTDVIARIFEILLNNLLVLEVCQKGNEASTVALFDTVIAVAQQVSVYVTRGVGFPFNSRALGAVTEDTEDSRLAIMEVQFIVIALHIVGIFSVFLIPSQKQEMNMWKSRSLSPLLIKVTIVAVLFLFVFAVVESILAVLNPALACHSDSLLWLTFVPCE
eukprot:Nk52_evm9s241 gene=Nk52_evmTU9s241